VDDAERRVALAHIVDQDAKAMMSESCSNETFLRSIFFQIESGDFSRPAMSASMPAAASLP
jgi:hypothetical protein